MRCWSITAACVAAAMAVSGCQRRGWATIRLLNTTDTALEDVRLEGVTPDVVSVKYCVKETSVTLPVSFAFDRVDGVRIHYSVGGEARVHRLDVDSRFPDSISNNNQSLELKFTDEGTWEWKVVLE